MEGYGPETYGERIAETYDRWYERAPFLETEAAVETLAELAGEGPVLELAIGTGRIAIPLAELGVDVHGIDSSQAMVAKLREKPGGGRISVTIGDFADVAAEGSFTLVFVAFNTFFALTTQDDQVRCFENAARRLTENGVFVLEAFVPDLARFDRGQRVEAESVEVDEVRLGVARHDPVGQLVQGQHLHITGSGVRLYPLSIRYAFPSELDLMARLAGLRLRERWGSWRKEPFTEQSGKHVSVYGR